MLAMQLRAGRIHRRAEGAQLRLLRASSPFATHRCPRAPRRCIAAEVGHLELAHDYVGEAALMDLDDLEHNTRDGLHIASLAGVWIALVAGFGGMRDHDHRLSFAPRLPDALSRLSFGIRLPGRRLRVTVTPTAASYVLLDGAPLPLLHHGQPITVTTDEPQPQPIPPRPDRPAPTQPPGRAPAPRRSAHPSSPR